MLEQAQPKWIKGMMALEIAVLCVTALAPLLIAGGVVVWLIDLLTFGALSNGLGGDAMLAGYYLASGSALAAPVSGGVLGLSIVQYRRFRTPCSIVVIVLSAVHLSVVLFAIIQTLL